MTNDSNVEVNTDTTTNATELNTKTVDEKSVSNNGTTSVETGDSTTDDNLETQLGKVSPSIAEKEFVVLNEIEAQVKKCKGNICNEAWRLGVLLANAKKYLCQRGEFQNWLINNVQIEPRQAQRFMLLAEKYSSSEDVLKHGYTKALVMAVLDPDERVDFLKETYEVNEEEKSVDEMSVSDLQIAIKIFKGKGLKTKTKEEPNAYLNDWYEDKLDEKYQIVKESVGDIETKKFFNGVKVFFETIKEDKATYKKYERFINELLQLTFDAVKRINPT
jgi:hypothetical protein